MVANTRHLDDEEDLLGFCEKCNDLMVNWKARRWVRDDWVWKAEETFQEMMAEVDEIEKTYRGTGKFVKNESPDPGKIGALWSELSSFAKNPEKNVIWHEWRESRMLLTRKDGKPIGYGGNKLMKSVLLTEKSLIQHEYSGKPKPVKLDLTAIDQDPTVKMYFGCASAAELDAICSVPSLDPAMDSSTFSYNVLNETLDEDEWQRTVDQIRLKEIRNFASGKDNYLVNPVLLYADLDNHNCITEAKTLNGKGTLKVDFSFLQKRGPGYQELTNYLPKPGEEDTRPLWIIDGQHRVRGFGSSERGSEMVLPFIVLVAKEGNIEPDFCARIFTEINTKAVPIETLHQMFMSYRFGMKMGKMDFSHSEGGRSYRRAYEMALYMASQPESPLHNMIQFQKPPGQRRSHHYVVNAHNWVDMASKWFSGKKGVYYPVETDSYNDEELFNFFKAFEQTCSAAEWSDGPRWIPGANKRKPLLQFEGPFLSLLQLFPEVVRRIIGRTDSPRPIPIVDFFDEMKPLQNVDWNSQVLKDSKLSGRTNHNISHLRMWMLRAIENGTSESKEDILDKNKRSIPGKGLLAPPAEPSISVESDVDWPTGSMALILKSKRPEHTLNQSWWVKFDTHDGPREWNRSEVRKAMSKGKVRDEFVIEFRDVPSGATKVEIYSRMHNGIDEAISDTREFKP